ncbi:MAG: hypothetical protein N3G19_02640 [Candidatus Pacearchaeota archaeon]|nr:hypothetical protein [Candidatus Pacearchaeota archaeon]
MENFIESLNSAEQKIKTADHIIYITYPLIKEKRLLKKTIEELHESASSIIRTLLSYEAFYKRIGPNETSLTTFKEKCASRFNISPQELETILELFSLVEKYKDSAMEFVRKDGLVIMNDNLKTESISIDSLKKYLSAIKILLQKTKAKMEQEFFGLRKVQK